MRVLKCKKGAALLTAAVLLAWSAGTSAQALTAQECSANYQAAKADGSLNGQGWNDFRREHCGAATTSSDSKAAQANPGESKPEPKPEVAKSDVKPESKAKAKSAAAPAVPQGPAVYPTAIDTKFAKEKPTLARLHTCAEQWKANKAANTTGGLRWIQKGGGYWSECNKRLKGQS